ncbi:thymidylate synthase [Mesorhizobium yinganensis]|uniref:thymidylate synthase n=1 Tax=Mesorhizobium yinganensis TaxID=3157707 RepID=UPI0032B6F9DF
MPVYRNISFATAQSFSDLLSNGDLVDGRGDPTKELLSRVTVLSRPAERYLFLPERDVSPILQFAETMWVLAGRNDVEWLERYSPKAPQYSDDGRVWRAGYGPRLRNWPGGVDQLGQARRLLIESRQSRRAVISLFDPAIDFIESKDIPCNNWLSLMVRGDVLSMNVAVRSNDALWGFSGINAFEWSVLQECVANWVGAAVGPVTYLASSFHLYQPFFDTAVQIVERFDGVTAYDHVRSAPFSTSFEQFDQRLSDWFAAEGRLRENPEERRSVGDAFLDSGLDLVRLKWGVKSGWSDARLRAELEALPDEDHTAAAYQHFGRLRPGLRDGIPQQGIAAFFAACLQGGGLADRFRAAIKALHATKDRVYGRAWKKRGERISILPNVARKVDRLEEYARGVKGLSDESALDTAVDFYVYTLKYRLWLAERDEPGKLLASGAPTPLSDFDANFDALVDRLKLDNAGDSKAQIASIAQLFEALWKATESSSEPRPRISILDALLKEAEALLATLFITHPPLVVRFIGQETAS